MKSKPEVLARYGDLLENLVILNLKTRYHGTMLGMLWSLISPLLLLIIFIFVFKYIFKIPEQFGIPDFPLFVFLGFVPWLYIQGTVLMASQSIVRNRSLIEKVWFPRAILPLADVVSGLLHHIISFLILFLALMFYRQSFDILLVFVYLPLFVLIQTILIVGLSLYLACLNVFYRDTGYILEVALMIGFYLSPIFYDITMIPTGLHKFYMLNPMTGIILGYRSIFLDNSPPDTAFLMSSVIGAIIMLAVGYMFFISAEEIFAEEI